MANSTYEDLSRQILNATANAKYIGPNDKILDCFLTDQQFGAMFPHPRATGLLNSRWVNFDGEISMLVTSPDYVLSKEQATAALVQAIEERLGSAPADGSADIEASFRMTLHEGSRGQATFLITVKGTLTVMTAR